MNCCLKCARPQVEHTPDCPLPGTTFVAIPSTLLAALKAVAETVRVLIEDRHFAECKAITKLGHGQCNCDFGPVRTAIAALDEVHC